MSRFTLSILFVLAVVSSSGQNISVTFSGTGAATQIDNVIATNLRTNQSLTLPGNETLVLTSFAGIPVLVHLPNMAMVFPNPFSGSAMVQMNAQCSEQVNLKIHNMVGQVVAELNSAVQPGENEFVFTVNGAGIYLVSVTTGQGTAGYKVICTGINTAGCSIKYLGSGSSNSGNNSGKALKSLQTTYALGYKAGDFILYRCQSGSYTTIMADSPASSKNYSVEFVGCTDQDNKNYQAVKIGDQTWMGENLALLPNVHSSSTGSGIFSTTQMTDQQCTYETVATFYNYGLVIMDTHRQEDGFMVGNQIDTATSGTEDGLKEQIMAGAGPNAYAKIQTNEIRLFKPSRWLYVIVDGEPKYKWESYFDLNVMSKYLDGLPDMPGAVILGNMGYSGCARVLMSDGEPIRTVFFNKNPTSYFCYAKDNGSSGGVENIFSKSMEDSLVRSLVVDGASPLSERQLNS